MSSTGSSTSLGPILFVAHNDVSSAHFGGVEVYLSRLAQALKDSVNVFLYVPNSQKQFQEARLINAQGEIVELISFETQFTNWQLNNNEREAVFESLLKRYHFSLVHFHHLSGHPVSLMNSARRMGVPSVFSFHDFFSVCHIANLIGEKKRYCDSDALSFQSCDQCLNTIYGISFGSQKQRRKFWCQLLKLNDALIFNTNSSFDIVSAIYPEIAQSDKVHILPVAINDLPKNTGILLQRSPISPPLRIAILGNFYFHKGADLIVGAIEALQNDSIEFHIFGSVEERYVSILRRFPNVILHGAYSPETIPMAAKACNISLHVSIWPETYLLTLSESWQLGLVPIVSDIGALGERVRHGINGFKIPPNSTDALIEILRDLVRNPLKITAINRQILADLPIAFLPEHIRQLLNIYKSVINNNQLTRVNPSNFEELLSNTQNNAPINIEWASFDQKPHPNQSGFRATYNYLINQFRTYLSK